MFGSSAENRHNVQHLRMYRQALVFACLPRRGRILSAKTSGLHQTVHEVVSSATTHTGVQDAGTLSANLHMA